MRMTMLLAAMLALNACDKYEADVVVGQQGRDQAKEVVAIDADQKIKMARQLISAGKLVDAERLIDAYKDKADKLPPATQEKLRLAQEELEKAKK